MTKTPIMGWCGEKCIIRQILLDKKDVLTVTIRKNCKCASSEKSPVRIVKIIWNNDSSESSESKEQ